MSGSDAASVLSRGGNLRLTPPLTNLLGSVLGPLALAMVGARAIGEPYEGWLLLVTVLAAALVFALRSRSFVTVVGSMLRWRGWGRVREVSLAEVDLPQRSGGVLNDRLVVRVGSRAALTLYRREWGRAALDSLEERLRYNARVARPRAQSR